LRELNAQTVPRLHGKLVKPSSSNSLLKNVNQRKEDLQTLAQDSQQATGHLHKIIQQLNCFKELRCYNTNEN